jgi:hypothetical protein
MLRVKIVRSYHRCGCRVFTMPGAGIGLTSSLEINVADRDGRSEMRMNQLARTFEAPSSLATINDLSLFVMKI